jgi:predicted amidohydrolase YtcJ
MKLASTLGLTIAVHAIGDRANARALELFEKSGAASKNCVCRIEHAQIVRNQDVDRFRQLGIWAVVQPSFYATDHEWALARLGLGRMKIAYRWRTLVEGGIRFAASSDSPIEDCDPIAGIQLLAGSLLERAREKLTAAEAVRSYTIAAAKMSRQPKSAAIKPGNYADLTILDRPVTAAGAQVLATFVEGEPIWSGSSKLV